MGVERFPENLAKRVAFNKETSRMKTCVKRLCVAQRSITAEVLTSPSSRLLDQSQASTHPVQYPGSSWPVTESVKVAGITIGAPLKDDLGVSSISSSIASLRSNIPLHIRESLTPPSMSTILHAAEPTIFERLFSKRTGLVPTYPNLTIEPYRKGQIAAYHYPSTILPVGVSRRIPADFRVDLPDWKAKPVLLLDVLLGQPRVIFTFSGEGYSTPYSGVRMWKKIIDRGLSHHEIHFHSSWLSRKTSVLTKLLFKEEDTPNRIFIYTGKWSDELSLNFHVYNRQLPSILLVDSRGYIRWHAVGLPTDKAVEVFSEVVKSLS